MSEKLKLLKEESKKPWYKDGLYFKCTGCGKCCTGSPGFVWLTKTDIKKLSKLLEISEAEFLKLYARKIKKKYSLKEDPESYDCVFLSEGKFCKVYKDRPIQCTTYPYWLENIESKKQWEEEAKFCEGINHEDAELTTFEEIQKQILEYLETR